MIKAIKMKNCATYPSVGAVIENCQKVNFFYGPNGSGKSTISNFLQAPTELQYRECEIKWENDTATDELFAENAENSGLSGETLEDLLLFRKKRVSIRYKLSLGVDSEAFAMLYCSLYRLLAFA